MNRSRFSDTQPDCVAPRAEAISEMADITVCPQPVSQMQQSLKGRQMKRIVIFAAAFGTACVSNFALAASPPTALPEQVAALRTCRAIIDTVNRAACYDGATDALLVAAQKRQIVFVDSKEIKATRRGLFGFSLPKLPFLDNSVSSGETEDARTLIAKVSGVSSAGYGKVRVRLEDGALWETVESSTDLEDLKIADTITLRKGSLGAYFLEWRTSHVQARRLLIRWP